MARATSFFYCDEDDRFSRMLEELNVQYALEGSIREVGRKVRISVQLVDCQSGKQLWGDRYVHEASAISQVQDEVVSLIVGVLENRILKDQGQLSARPAPARRRAYEFLARGKELLAKSGPGDEEMAERCFNNAIQCDPGFSRAYSSLAAIYYRRAVRRPGSADWEWMITRALGYGNRAVRLDSLDGSAHVAAGYGRLMSREYEAARQHYDVAGELNPNDAEILIARAHASLLLGDPEYGLELATRALHLNPVCPPGYMSQVGALRFFAGRFEDALHSFDAEQSMRFEMAALKASAYGYLGDLGDAYREARRYLDGVERSWRGAEPPGEAECIAWLETLLPLREKEHREYLRRGLQTAGIFGASGTLPDRCVLRVAN
jgi:adenylate cyclase